MSIHFKLSTANKVYLGIISLIMLMLFMVFSDKSAYQTGALFGRLFTLSLLPTLLAWITWRLAGKKQKVARVTFNIVLSSLLFGQVGRMGASASAG
jgi:hypothetical protein